MHRNLEVARAIYSSWERGDFGSTDWAHPDLELVMADGPDPGSWEGLTGVAEGWRGFLSLWEEWRTEAEEYRELEDDRVLVVARFIGRGKTSGVELAEGWATGASLLHFADGKVTKIVLYFDAGRAVQAEGLAG